MTNFNELVAFLLARIDEDEEFAKRSAWPTVEDQYNALIRRERMLAECDAKRRIIEQYQDAKHHYEEEHDIDGSIKYDDGGAWEFLTRLETWERAVKLLALPYTNHRHYREEWRP